MTPELTPSGGRLEFGRVMRGYHPAQVDRCLQDLGEQLVRAENRAAELQHRLDQPPAARHQPPHRTTAHPDATPVDVYAVAGLYAEVMALREEAVRQVESAHVEAAAIIAAARERANQADRDFEIALAARRQREREADARLRQTDFAPPTPSTASGTSNGGTASPNRRTPPPVPKRGNQRTTEDPPDDQPTTTRRKPRPSSTRKHQT